MPRTKKEKEVVNEEMTNQTAANEGTVSGEVQKETLTVEATVRFYDKCEKKRRNAGDVFEVTQERYEEILKVGDFIELVEDGFVDEEVDMDKIIENEAQRAKQSEPLQAPDESVGDGGVVLDGEASAQ